MADGVDEVYIIGPVTVTLTSVTQLLKQTVRFY